MRGFGAPDVAAWQAGIFTAEQAAEAGWSMRQVRYRLETGRWHRVVGRGLAAAPRPPTGWPAESLAQAARLTWCDAVVGYQVAGCLWGFPIPSPELMGPVHVFTVVKHRARLGLVAHQRREPPWPLGRAVGAVAITSQMQTALDCLTVMPPTAPRRSTRGSAPGAA